MSDQLLTLRPSLKDIYSFREPPSRTTHLKDVCQSIGAVETRPRTTMKLIKHLILPLILLLSSITYASDKPTIEQLRQLADNEASYLSKDGKTRITAYVDTDKDGNVGVKYKKQYLPAVTDGINRDKTSKFAIPPSAKKTAKYFAKGASHAIFLSMIIDVLGEGVDYVLDEKNNSIQYKNNKIECYLGNKKFSSLGAVNKYHCEVLNKQEARGTRTNDNYLYYSDCSNTYTVFHCTVLQQETKVMNDEEFAQAVIELAKADNAKAKKVVLDVAKQAVSDGDYDKEIQKAVDELNADETKDDTQDNQDNTSDSSNASSSDSTNTDSQDDTQATPKPSNPQTDDNGGNDKDKFELPVFCDWAKHVCDFIDWFKKEPELPEAPSPQIPIDDKSDLANADINKKLYDVGGECPPPKVIALPLGNIEIPYDSLCLFFSKNSPFVIAIAYIIGAYIVMGRG